MSPAANDQLPGPPDPWAPSEMPRFRSRPPYLMTEMIAAEPARTSIAPKMASPATVVVTAIGAAATPRLTGVTPGHVTARPPGARCGPLPLRI